MPRVGTQAQGGKVREGRTPYLRVVVLYELSLPFLVIPAPACLLIHLPLMVRKAPRQQSGIALADLFHSDWWFWSLFLCLGQLTHGVMNKELKYCKNPEDLECNENVKHKTKEYIKKYMQKFGAVYKPKEDTELE